MRRLVLLTPIAWLVIAWSHDPLLPEHNVNGPWKSFNAPRLVIPGDSVVACRISTPTIEFVQSGTTLGGRTSGIVFGCGASENTRTSRTIINGWVRGDSVSFDMGTEDWRSAGTFKGDTMSGITTIRIVRDVFVTGLFTAVR